jgi:hypothetical protein
VVSGDISSVAQHLRLNNGIKFPAFDSGDVASWAGRVSELRLLFPGESDEVFIARVAAAYEVDTAPFYFHRGMAAGLRKGPLEDYLALFVRFLGNRLREIDVRLAPFRFGPHSLVEAQPFGDAYMQTVLQFFAEKTPIAVVDLLVAAYIQHFPRDVQVKMLEIAGPFIERGGDPCTCMFNVVQATSSFRPPQKKSGGGKPNNSSPNNSSINNSSSSASNGHYDSAFQRVPPYQMASPAVMAHLHRQHQPPPPQQPFRVPDVAALAAELGPPPAGTPAWQHFRFPNSQTYYHACRDQGRELGTGGPWAAKDKQPVAGGPAQSAQPAPGAAGAR